MIEDASKQGLLACGRVYMLCRGADSQQFEIIMNTKLRIDASQGIIDVEGSADFVREIYMDFRDMLVARQKSFPASDAEEKTDSDEPGKLTPPAKPRRRAKLRKTSPTDGAGEGVIADAPKLDKDLDTSKLSEYFGQFELSNNPEKILVFLKFLVDELGVETPNTDQVYTCYEAANERVPKAFAQAFRDASGRKFGFINYNSPTDLQITTAGSNHFKFDLKRKPAE